MNISRTERRVLHLRALGGRIDTSKRHGPKIADMRCISRDGLLLSDCLLLSFRRLRRKRLIAKEGGGQYRITRPVRLSVRSQPDNQG